MQASSKKASERKITGGEKGRACKHLTNTAQSAHLQKNSFLYQNDKVKMSKCACRRVSRARYDFSFSLRERS